MCICTGDCPAFQQTQTDAIAAAGSWFSATVKEPDVLVLLVPCVMLLGFHSQSNSCIQNSCYRGKMCLITDSKALTMKAFQRIF